MSERLDNTHLSVHIEKTGGTTLYATLRAIYGRDNILIYSPNSDSVFSANNLVMLLRFSKGFDKFRSTSLFAKIMPVVHLVAIRSLSFEDHYKDVDLLFSKKWKMIHGHFSADRFDDVVDNPFKTVVLRNPLERTYSHFKYWKKARGILNQRVKIPFDPKMNFMDFALREEMQNFQTKALGKNNLSDFDVVGVTESALDFLSRIAKMRNLDIPRSNPLHHLNKSGGNSLESLSLNRDFLKKFTLLNELDYAVYNCAKELARHPLDNNFLAT